MKNLINESLVDNLDVINKSIIPSLKTTFTTHEFVNKFKDSFLSDYLNYLKCYKEKNQVRLVNSIIGKFLSNNLNYLHISKTKTILSLNAFGRKNEIQQWKKTIVFLIIFLCQLTNTFSQTDTICGILPVKNGLIYYSETVEINNATAAQLYNNTKIWISEKFQNAKNVIQTDTENTILTLTGLINFPYDPPSNLRVSMNIQFKDGKYKYELMNVYWVINSRNIDNRLEIIPVCTECRTETLRVIDFSIQEFTNSLKTKLNSVDFNW